MICELGPSSNDNDFQLVLVSEFIRGQEAAMPAAVELRSVTARRGGRTIWADADIELPTGAFTALIGANGSGKSTLIQIILGLLRPATGSVRVFGTAAKRGNADIGLVPQGHSLFNADEIRGIDLVALNARGARLGVRRTKASERESVDAALAAVGATAYADQRLRRLSGGQRQRISIAAALVGEPALVILDEPLAGLDLAGQVGLVELVHHLNHERGLTVLFATHDLNPVLDHIDSAIYIADGRPRFATVNQITDPGLLTRIYGTAVQVTRAADGCVFARTPTSRPVHP